MVNPERLRAEKERIKQQLLKILGHSPYDHSPGDQRQFWEVVTRMYGDIPHALAYIYEELRVTRDPGLRVFLIENGHLILSHASGETMPFREGHHAGITFPAEDVNHMEATWGFYQQASTIVWRKEMDKVEFAAMGRFPIGEDTKPESHSTQAYQEMVGVGDFASEWDKIGDLPDEVKENWTWEGIGHLDELAYNVMLARQEEAVDQARALQSIAAAGPTTTSQAQDKA